MPSAIDSYHITAKYYDGAYAAKQDLVDLPFYLELAEKSPGPILEIACGTGRVLIPIARKGKEIHGVDNSAPMLEILKTALAQEPAAVQERVRISEGDMRTFRLGAKFPLIIIPFRPMQHMYTVADQVSALQTAAAHLTGDGILAFDVFYPKFDVIMTGIGEEVQEMEFQSDTDAGATVRRYFRKDAVDKINQVFYFTFIYRTIRGGEVVREETEGFQLGYYTYPHLRALFLLAGLQIIEEYGSFARTPMDNAAEQMIFLLRKAH